MTICFYITGHGYGHGVRCCALANAFSEEIGIFFRSSLPLFFFEEEMHRQFEYRHGEFDCGCIQYDGVTVDIPATLNRYAQLARRNADRLTDELDVVKKHKVQAIISDIVPFAFDVARQAGIPSIAFTNFTWYDIYASYTTSFPWFQTCLEGIHGQYSAATMLFAVSPALPMDFFPRRRKYGIVGRKGRNNPDILQPPRPAHTKHTALIYMGNFGMDSLSWSMLARFSEWCFYGLYPLPDAPDNYRILKRPVRYQDVLASVDVVIAKPGYSCCAECFLNGTPLIYLPRSNFAEYPYLDEAIRKWGHGSYLSDEAFRNFQWDDALRWVVEHGRAPRMDSAIDRCARDIELFVGNPPEVF